MSGFIVFGVILVIIWGIIASTTAANKAKEQERRRQLQAELQRMAMHQAARNAGVAPPQPQRATRQISQGIADRFPDVLLPPTPRPQRQPMRAPVSSVPNKRPLQGHPRRPATRRPMPPVLPAIAPAAPPMTRQPPATPPAIVPSSAQRSADGRGVNAPAIARWAKPSTLRQQFILTEIFQPPLALREPKF
jgi:hypothetical protein